MDDLPAMFKSIVDQDDMPVVICNTAHQIVYMNPAAEEHYADRGGRSLIGLIIFDCHSPQSAKRIDEVVKWFARSSDNNIVHTHYGEETGKDIYMVALRDEDGNLIGYYEKHVSRVRDPSPTYRMP